MASWRSYDEIAGRYDAVWGPRFEATGALLAAEVASARARRALDIGSGTGAVARALKRKVGSLSLLVACDVSVPMLSRARQAAVGARVAAGDAAALPFRSESFDLATASFVLSHVPDYRAALKEAFRVLARPSAFAASNWAPATDPYLPIWRGLLDAAVGSDAVERAAEDVAPWESHLAEPQNLRAALVEAGFTDVRVRTARLDVTGSNEEYIEDRELSSGGRCGRHVLGEREWRRFLDGAGEELRRRVGGSVAYSRDVVIAVGAKG